MCEDTPGGEENTEGVRQRKRKRKRGGFRWTPEEETVLTSMLARRLQLPTRWHVRGDLAWALSALPRLGLGG